MRCFVLLESTLLDRVLLSARHHFLHSTTAVLDSNSDCLDVFSILIETCLALSDASFRVVLKETVSDSFPGPFFTLDANLCRFALIEDLWRTLAYVAGLS